MSDLYRIARLRKLQDRATDLAADLAEHANVDTIMAADVLMSRIAADIAELEKGLKGGAKAAHQLHGPMPPKGDA